MARVMLCVMRTFGWDDRTTDATLRIITSQSRHEWSLAPPPPDAAVDRAREGAAVSFLRSECDVLVMVDSDVSWANNEDIEYLVDKALELEAVVGGMVSKKGIGLGWGARLTDDVPHELYSDEIVELPKHAYMGSAFMAIHRSVFLSIVRAGAPWCPMQGVWPFFLPCILENEVAGYQERLSEDWAFCHYAREAGKKVYALMKPVTFHRGGLQYSALDGNPRWGEVHS